MLLKYEGGYYLHHTDGFQILRHDELFYEEPGFNSVLDYIDKEAARSKVLLTTSKQGRAVNNICLKLFKALKKYNHKFSVVVEAIYRMAVLRLIVSSEAVEPVLMPLFKEYQNEIAEVEVFPWTLDEVNVLVFIDNVFEEITHDDAFLLFEHVDHEKWIAKPLDDELLEHDDNNVFEADDDDDNTHFSRRHGIEKIRDLFPPEVMPKNDSYIINTDKTELVNKIYYELCNILDKCNAIYSISFLDENPGISGWLSIRVITDVFNPNDCGNDIEAFRYVVNNVDLIQQNVVDGKIVMVFTIRYVYIDFRRAECELDGSRQEDNQ